MAPRPRPGPFCHQSLSYSVPALCQGVRGGREHPVPPVLCLTHPRQLPHPEKAALSLHLCRRGNGQFWGLRAAVLLPFASSRPRGRPELAALWPPSPTPELTAGRSGGVVTGSSARLFPTLPSAPHPASPARPPPTNVRCGLAPQRGPAALALVHPLRPGLSVAWRPGSPQRGRALPRYRRSNRSCSSPQVCDLRRNR